MHRLTAVAAQRSVADEELFLTAVAAQRSVADEELFLDAASLTGAPWYTGVPGEIARTRWVILVGALGGFGLSLVVDALAPTTSTAALFLEDSAKLLGGLTWTQSMSLTGVDVARSTIRDARAGAAARHAPLVGT